MRAAAILLIGSLTGCAGMIGEEDEGMEQTEGQKMFSSTVGPLLRTQCASCHEGAGSGPAFMGAGGEGDDYDALRSNARIVGSFDSSTALLLTKGAHAGVGWWSSAQSAKITDWINLEASTGIVAGDGDILAAWAGCMTLENWDDSMMGRWAGKVTDTGATCGGCHAAGEYGFFSSPTSDIMYAQQRTQKGIPSFFQVSAASATPTVVPALDKLRNKCAGGNLHPACAVDDQYVDYLKRYASLTNATMAAGLCDAPGYKTMTDPL
jgi:mono/diheme cytochrome c family protein